MKGRIKLNTMFLINLVLSLSALLTGCQSKSTAGSGKEPPARKFYAWNEFSMGADLSYVNQIEDKGGIYRDSGKVVDPFTIFKNHGTNTVRVRLWHTPGWQLPVTGGKMYSDLYDVEKTIRRAKQAGMAVNLDLHYSDDWADPQKQYTPAAWQGLSYGVIKDSVYQYTLSVLNYLASKNLIPEMIQVGNEINPGLLHPYGKIENNNFKPLAGLLSAGIKAVRDFSATAVIKPKIILHVAQLQDADWWTKGVIETEGVTDFDIIGLSHYTKWSQVKTMAGVTDAIRRLVTKYNKTVMIVETGYPWTGDNFDSYGNIFSPSDGVSGYPLTKEGQLQYMKDLVQAIRDGGGKGIMYWEPAWISSPMKDRWGTGSSWENLALFDFQGNTLPAMEYMTFNYK